MKKPKVTVYSHLPRWSDAELEAVRQRAAERQAEQGDTPPRIEEASFRDIGLADGEL